MKTHQLRKFLGEIESRGGETFINHIPYGRVGWKHVEERTLEPMGKDKSEGRVVHLLGCEGWRYYSRNSINRFAQLRYLVGADDSGLWAIRVPGTVETVSEAIEWIQPSTVKKARAERRRVLRQGNLYFVESPKARNYLDDDEGFGEHEYYHRARVVLHPEHRPLRLPAGRWQAVEQKSLFGTRGGAAD